MKLTIYQVDAFTSKVFGGNPAAVIPLQSWLDENLMQKIAQGLVILEPSQILSMDKVILDDKDEVKID